MQILLKSQEKFRKIFSLSFADKLRYSKVFLLTGVFRLAMLIIPFRKLRRYMGELNKESTREINDIDYNKAKKISIMVKTVANNTPWESKCLVMALTAQYLLRHENIDSTLYLGVANESNLIKSFNEKNKADVKVGKDKLVAHAWIRCGESYVTGGNGEGYGVVAKFMKGGIKN